MIRVFLYAAAGAIVVGFAFWAYEVNYTTQAAAREVRTLRAEIAREREAIGMLNAEWAYLNRPERLRALAEDYFSVLQLGPMTAAHFGTPAEVPLPPADDESQLADVILDLVLEAGQ